MGTASQAMRPGRRWSSTDSRNLSVLIERRFRAPHARMLWPQLILQAIPLLQAGTRLQDGTMLNAASPLLALGVARTTGIRAEQQPQQSQIFKHGSRQFRQMHHSLKYGCRPWQTTRAWRPIAGPGTHGKIPSTQPFEPSLESASWMWARTPFSAVTAAMRTRRISWMAFTSKARMAFLQTLQMPGSRFRPISQLL